MKVIEGESMKNLEIATNHLGRCEVKDCKFNLLSDDKTFRICAFGMRETFGCYYKEDAVKVRVDEIKALIKLGVQRGDAADVPEMLDRMVLGKTYYFLFKGHEYTISDSARDQRCCPHCGFRNSRGDFWKRRDKEFVGAVKAERGVLMCFECSNCFKKFYYHSETIL